MIIAWQPARLGNKLFTLAVAISKSIDLNMEYKLFDDWSLNNNLINPISIASDTNSYKTYYEVYASYNFIIEPNTIIRGFWQSENYFKHNSDKIREILKCKFESNLRYDYKDILKHKHTISIHIRRGDYVVHPYFPVLPTSYYTNAISLMIEKIKDDDFLFLIFSDDIEFCKKEFGYHPKFCYVEEPNEILSLYLMSYCSHNIIANSSYSWWGAWLNENPNKIVICPTHFKLFAFKNFPGLIDYFPNEWIQIDFEEKESRELKKMDFVLENLIKFLSVFKIKDELNLTSLPNIFSYTDSSDLLISNNINDNVKYVITLNKPKNKRFLVFGKYYLIDNFPNVQKELCLLNYKCEKENEISLLSNAKINIIKTNLYKLFLSWLYNYKYYDNDKIFNNDLLNIYLTFKYTNCDKYIQS